MENSDRNDKIDVFFKFYKIRLTTLKSLQNFLFFHDTNGEETHLFGIESQILALSYLDALAASNNQQISEFIKIFSNNGQLIDHVSVGRIHNFCDSVKTIQKEKQNDFILPLILIFYPSLKRGDRFKKIIDGLIHNLNSTGFNSLVSQLHEFTYNEIKALAMGSGTIRSTKCDSTVDETLVKFKSYLKQENQDDSYLNDADTLIRELFGKFTFGEIIYRDYRNPLIHNNFIPSKSPREENLNEPYYYLAADDHTCIRLTIPNSYFITVLEECIKKYESHCIWKSHDPILPFIEYQI